MKVIIAFIMIVFHEVSWASENNYIWYRLQADIKNNEYTHSPEYQFRTQGTSEYYTSLYRYYFRTHFDEYELHIGGAYFDHAEKTDERRYTIGGIYTDNRFLHRTYFEFRDFVDGVQTQRLRYRTTYQTENNFNLYQEIFLENMENKQELNEFRLGVEYIMKSSKGLLHMGPSIFILPNNEKRGILFMGYIW